MASRVEKVAGETLVLDCEVSRSNAEVTWKKNGEEVEDSRNITILEDGVVRQLTVHSLTLEDAGQYVCDAKDDVMDFNVKVQGRLWNKRCNFCQECIPRFSVPVMLFFSFSFFRFTCKNSWKNWCKNRKAVPSVWWHHSGVWTIEIQCLSQLVQRQSVNWWHWAVL